MTTPFRFADVSAISSTEIEEMALEDFVAQIEREVEDAMALEVERDLLGDMFVSDEELDDCPF